MGGRFTVLGSGTGVPTSTRGPSGHLLEAGGERVLLDSGSGTTKRLAEAGVSLDTLDRVFYTHYHLDHFLDLPGLIFALRNPALDRDRVFPVYGPAGLEDLVSGLRDLFGPWMVPDRTRIELHEVGPGWRAEFPFGKMSAASTRHCPESLAYRIDLPGAGAIAYSGDTGYCNEVVDLARDVDVFVCECALTGTDEFHLNGDQAGRMAAQAGVKCLVLTHFYPEVEGTDVAGRVRKHFQGKVILAEDLMTFSIEDS